jgi:hypothetical protein
MQTSFEHLIVPYLYSWLSSNVKDMALKVNFSFVLLQKHLKKLMVKKS